MTIVHTEADTSDIDISLIHIRESDFLNMNLHIKPLKSLFDLAEAGYDFTDRINEILQRVLHEYKKRRIYNMIKQIKYSELSEELTPEENAELEALENRPIVYDEDCPEMTEEMLKQFQRVENMSQFLEMRKNKHVDL